MSRRGSFDGGSNYSLPMIAPVGELPDPPSRRAQSFPTPGRIGVTPDYGMKRPNLMQPTFKTILPGADPIRRMEKQEFDEDGKRIRYDDQGRPIKNKQSVLDARDGAYTKTRIRPPGSVKERTMTAESYKEMDRRERLTRESRRHIAGVERERAFQGKREELIKKKGITWIDSPKGLRNVKSLEFGVPFGDPKSKTEYPQGKPLPGLGNMRDQNPGDITFDVSTKEPIIEPVPQADGFKMRKPIQGSQLYDVDTKESSMIAPFVFKKIRRQKGIPYSRLSDGKTINAKNLDLIKDDIMPFSDQDYKNK